MTNLSETIEQAKNADNSGMFAIVTETKLSKRSRNKWFGFRFSKECLEIGSTLTNEDGSISKVLEVINP